MTQREKEILALIQSDPMIQQQDIAARLGIARSSVAVHISNLQKKGYIAGKGYVLRSGSYAVVVGGVNMDIGGRSFSPLVAEDSNPGAINISLGGVGRNIAHNLSLMGKQVRMLTAYGDDPNGAKVMTSCAELGIDISNALHECIPLLHIVWQVYLVTGEHDHVRLQFIDLGYSSLEALDLECQVIDIFRTRHASLHGRIKSQLRICNLDYNYWFLRTCHSHQHDA